MKTILEIALSTKYSTEQIPNIIEIVGATPNPDMAVQILMDIYEEPVLQQKSKRGDVEREITHVDFWNERVSYKYTEEECKSFYVHKDTDQSLITLENYEEYKVDWDSEDAVHMNLKTGVFKERTNSTSISSWISDCENEHNAKVK